MAKGKYQEWLTEDGQLLLRKMARDGLTDQEIADEIGINVCTLYDWKKKHPKISDALKKPKKAYDSEVEEALERSALGYYVKERKWKNKWNAKTKEFELILDEEREVWVKPDTTAQIFWLKNRDKLHWRDKQEVQLDTDGEEVGVIALPAVSPAELPPEMEADNG